MTFQLLASGKTCTTEVKNLGNIATPELCYDATIADAACGPAFMYTPVYPMNWGCRCCTNAATTGSSNVNWDLYEIVEQTFTVTSDGTQAKPYCSWSGNCPTWDSTAQNLCALKLCEASGYSSATYVSSNPTTGMCTQSIISGSQWYYVYNEGVTEQRSLNSEVAVTAECSGSRRRLGELPRSTKRSTNANVSDDDGENVERESVWTRWLNVPDLDESRGQAVVKPAAGPLLRSDAHHRF